MNIRNNPILRQKLAAEYVLGTLRGHARSRFEQWLYQDADLRNITAEWEQRLAPMAEFAGAVAPPPRLWHDIERRLGLQQRAPSRWAFWRNDNLAFWRSLGMVSTALAAMLLVIVMRNAPAPQTVAPASPAYAATLSDEQTHAAMLVTADPRRKDIDIRLVANLPVDQARSLHLWAIPKSGAPRSLGLVTASHTVLPLPDQALGDDVVALAVSLEPKGGSPNPHAPTGPVIYKGALMRM